MDFGDLDTETAALRSEYSPSAVYCRRRRLLALRARRPHDEVINEELELLNNLAGSGRLETALVLIDFDMKRLRTRLGGEGSASAQTDQLLERLDRLEILQALLRLEVAKEERLGL